MKCILDYVNGQVLATIGLHICGRWRAKLFCEEDDNIPTPLCCHGVNVRTFYDRNTDSKLLFCHTIDMRRYSED